MTLFYSCRLTAVMSLTSWSEYQRDTCDLMMDSSLLMGKLDQNKGNWPLIQPAQSQIAKIPDDEGHENLLSCLEDTWVHHFD